MKVSPASHRDRPAFDPDRSAPIICFSHLRWDFVFQRPQHLMSRFAKGRRVFVFEEPILCDHHRPFLEYHPFPEQDVIALRPRVPHWWDEAAREAALAGLLDMLVATGCGGAKPVLWFYTPAMYAFARHVEAAAVVYDCMDELSAFRFAPPQLRALEAELMGRADVVFTGGFSLYEAKRDRHDNIHPFPSSVDGAHFRRARDGALPDPADQAGIPRPRLGFYGVIDERMDLDLLDAVARNHPDWQLVMVGPVVKIDHAALPRHPNIHYLGPKGYDELPAYLSGWDVALMPFAINEATRFISPTKTPEYLAAGRPVVSTPVTDVVRHYGGLLGVSVAAGAPAFGEACRAALLMARSPGLWRPEADALLAGQSWDETHARMDALLAEAVARAAAPPAPPASPLPAPAARPARRRKPYDVLVVGAGFAGAVMAERLAAGSGRRVLVVDRRPHLGGNAADARDAAGLLVGRYGPHVLHTDSREVVDYLSRFTRWRPYEHRVLARVRGALVPFPVNRTTLNAVFGLELGTEAEAAAFLAARTEPVAAIRTAEDAALAAMGRELYELLVRGALRKRWGLDPAELAPSAAAGYVRVLHGTDDRANTEGFQAVPLEGYTRLFEAMLDHPGLAVELGTDFADVAREGVADHTVFTGPIDAFFGHCYGRLPFGSLRFVHETRPVRRFQPVAVVEEPDPGVPHGRVIEHKHLSGQVSPVTTITTEFPSQEGEPFYPVPTPANLALYKRYEALALARPDVTFVGRLATYGDDAMDGVVGQALAAYRRLVERGIVPAGGAARPDASSAAALV